MALVGDMDEDISLAPVSPCCISQNMSSPQHRCSSEKHWRRKQRSESGHHCPQVQAHQVVSNVVYVLFLSKTPGHRAASGAGSSQEGTGVEGKLALAVMAFCHRVTTFSKSSHVGINSNLAYYLHVPLS